ncbi:MAG: LruC domain-containing protein [Halioglobus sp.]|jgi:LruC domain-containing protein
MYQFSKYIPMMAALVASVNAQTAPFETCPTEAFVAQGKPAVIYGVDLTSGAYNPLGETNTDGRLNAMGFNGADGYLYAWDKKNKKLVRIHSDYSVEPLVLDAPMNVNFYAGDVAVSENAYYAYRKNTSYAGLWRIPLDPTDPDYLKAEKVVSAQPLYLNIFDIAFHPDNDYMYSVDRAGRLFKVSPTLATSELLGSVGVKGTFGAVYFDVDGTLYISRNSDGKIYSVDVDAASPQATLFSYGPSSSSNDGARCALAAVAPPITPTLDYGDAPVSYGTRASEDGASHVAVGPRLGAMVDAEARAFPAPDESDDFKDDSDDEDGVQFITDLLVGEQTVISVSMTGSGYLNLWIDYNRNGQFDASELVIDDADSTVGSGMYVIDIPASAELGVTWVRARISSTQGLGPTGSADDGEVEDYSVTLKRPLTHSEYYPSANDYVTLAFEDLWPSLGDYDLNDFVVYYQTSITSDNTSSEEEASYIREITIKGEVAAVGASFHSGFGISIPGLLTSDIDADNVRLLVNDERPVSFDGDASGFFQPLRGLASRQNETAVLEITRDVWNIVNTGEGCSFHRTENNCGAAANATFSLTIPVITNVPASQVAKGIFNPFVFATNGILRSSIFKDEQGNIVAPGDALEIHLKNHKPTWRADLALLARASDVSEASTVDDDENRVTYQTSQGLPWAIEIGGRWCHPGEYQDITAAYPDFIDFVNSEGQSSSDWFHTNNAATHPSHGAQGYLYKEDGVLNSNCVGSN